MSEPQTFEQFTAELSSRLISVPSAQVDEEVKRALAGVVELLDVDRSGVLEFTADTDLLVSTHVVARPGVEPFIPENLRQARFNWYHKQLSAGRDVVIDVLPDGLPAEAQAERQYVTRFGMRSHIAVPVTVGGRHVCALTVGTFRAPRRWQPEDVARLRVIGQILANAIARKRADETLRAQFDEIVRLKEHLEAENAYLREEVIGGVGFEAIVGTSPALRQALGLAAQVAATDAGVLLLGETGTGKELVANAIHHRSTRSHGPLVKVNCAAIPATLLESELFGHEKGAFTGADAARMGRFEVADGGTLFLDEIGDLPLELQAKLLRVLEDREVQRLGATRGRRVDVRLIAATNRDLESAAATGRFRQDLYYRLAVFPVRLPPLRERRGDIALLAWSIIDRRQRDLGRRIERVPHEAMAALQSYDWPGNVRELQNVIERALILSSGPVLALDPAFAATPGVTGRTTGDRVDDVARAHIVAVLERCGWKIDGGGNAAEALGLHPNTLRSRMKKLGITRPRRAG